MKRFLPLFFTVAPAVATAVTPALQDATMNNPIPAALIAAGLAFIAALAKSPRE